MKVCQSCGTQNNDVNNFCGTCAAPLLVTPSQSAAKRIAPFYQQAWFWFFIGIIVIVFLFQLVYGSKDSAVSTTAKPTINLSNQIGSGSIDAYWVKIVGIELAPAHDGSPAVVVNYEWKNNSAEAESFAMAFRDKVYQNGVECESELFMDDDEKYPLDSARKDIQRGTTYAVQVAYKLNDEKTAIDVVVSHMYDLSEIDEAVKKTFGIAK